MKHTKGHASAKKSKKRIRAIVRKKEPGYVDLIESCEEMGVG